MAIYWFIFIVPSPQDLYLFTDSAYLLCVKCIRYKTSARKHILLLLLISHTNAKSTAFQMRFWTKFQFIPLFGGMWSRAWLFSKELSILIGVSRLQYVKLWSFWNFVKSYFWTTLVISIAVLAPIMMTWLDKKRWWKVIIWLQCFNFFISSVFNIVFLAQQLYSFHNKYDLKTNFWNFLI